MYRQCPYCFEEVLESQFDLHDCPAGDAKKANQPADQSRLPTELQFPGQLDDSPRMFLHQKCGTSSTLSSEELQQHLRNPLCYNIDPYCRTCHCFVDMSQAQIQDLNISVLHYMGRLRTLALQEYYPSFDPAHDLIFATPQAAAVFRQRAAEFRDETIAVEIIPPSFVDKFTYQMKFHGEWPAEEYATYFSRDFQFLVHRPFVEHFQSVFVHYDNGQKMFNVGRTC